MRNASQRFTNVIGSNRADEKERTSEPSKTNIVQSPQVLWKSGWQLRFVRIRQYTDPTGSLWRTPDGGRHFDPFPYIHSIHHCLEHSTGFQLKRGSNTELLACAFSVSHNTMSPYVSDLLHPYQPPRTLRSLDTSLLIVPRFCLETFGRRSFSVFGPTVWNSLPLSLRKTQCFSTFKKKLKTHPFEKHLS